MKKKTKICLTSIITNTSCWTLSRTPGNFWCIIDPGNHSILIILVKIAKRLEMRKLTASASRTKHIVGYAVGTRTFPVESSKGMRKMFCSLSRAGNQNLLFLASRRSDLLSRRVHSRLRCTSTVGRWWRGNLCPPSIKPIIRCSCLHAVSVMAGGRSTKTIAYSIKGRLRETESFVVLNNFFCTNPIKEMIVVQKKFPRSKNIFLQIHCQGVHHSLIISNCRRQPVVTIRTVEVIQPVRNLLDNKTFFVFFNEETSKK